MLLRAFDAPEGDAMRRNTILIAALLFIVLGALALRYLPPAQSARVAAVARQMQDAVNQVTGDSGGDAAQLQQEAELKAEEARIVAEQELEKTRLAVLESARTAQPESEMKPVLDAAAEPTPSEAEDSLKRANELLAQALKMADEAKAQIRIAQKQFDQEVRARPNLSILPGSAAARKKVSAQKSADPVTIPADKAEQPAPKRAIAPNAPLTEIERIFAESVIRFDWTRSILNDDAQGKIDTIAKTLKVNPDISVRIIGHTDGNGTEELNNWLGLIRARRVRQQLIAKGINPKRISVSSQGSKEPIESNDTPLGRWKNRRVEFAVSEK